MHPVERTLMSKMRDKIYTAKTTTKNYEDNYAFQFNKMVIVTTYVASDEEAKNDDTTHYHHYPHLVYFLFTKFYFCFFS